MSPSQTLTQKLPHSFSELLSISLNNAAFQVQGEAHLLNFTEFYRIFLTWLHNAILFYLTPRFGSF